MESLNQQEWVKLFSSVAHDYDIPMADLVSKYGHLFKKADKGPCPSPPPPPSSPFEVTEWEFEGSLYYVDKMHRVYTRCTEAPTFVGWKTSHGHLTKLPAGVVAE